VARPGEWVRVCLRPEDISLSACGATSPSSVRNHLPGRVLRVVPAGSHVRVTLDCGVTLVALVTHRSAEELALREGADIVAHFKATAPHLLPARRA
jgi:molybdate transport system ATP-binding protein